MQKIKVATIGSGNIGTDLVIKIIRLSKVLEMGALVGIDPKSDGLKRAIQLGVPATAEGIEGLVAMPDFINIKIVFDATSAGMHEHHDNVLRAHGKIVIDLTPSSIGLYTIPPVNGDQHLEMESPAPPQRSNKSENQLLSQRTSLRQTCLPTIF
jgi:acetaldehyde dehydrogenase